ncbi:MAG: cobyrinate a,c-diamide synthase [Campylobacterales bacterium]|nr:cobyrinate a,c-diamide synthase [Campylobacterales bacterium]
MRALCISATASNQGKTILTTALLYHFRDSVRPFKIGPDFIDPQFHTKICSTPSVNLDTFMMRKEQVQWIFQKYSDKKISICEGVMGFYDGMEKGCSAYDVSKLLDIPTILLLDGSSSYITVSAILKGLKTYRDDNTIKGVILNKLSSSSHFELIKNQILKDFSDVAVLGWIKNDLISLGDTHLGLDLENITKIESVSKEVLENIDIKMVENLANETRMCKNEEATNSEWYPFKKIQKIDKKLAIVSDANFSFLYHDNAQFLKEIFREVSFVSSVRDESIDADIVYIPGGYVETKESYERLKESHNFRDSLITHAKTKPIYAECAGMLYLGNSVDEKKMSGILDLDFTLHKRFQRMGYYYNSKNIKGHAFHYTNILDEKEGTDRLFKTKKDEGKVGSWQKERVFGTYLHVMFRSNTEIIDTLF